MTATTGGPPSLSAGESLVLTGDEGGVAKDDDNEDDNEDDIDDDDDDDVDSHCFLAVSPPPAPPACVCICALRLDRSAKALPQ